MSRKYTKVEALSEEVFRRKDAGETNREIGAHFGLSKAQIKGLVSRQNRKQRLIANGYANRHCKNPPSFLHDLFANPPLTRPNPPGKMIAV